MFEKYVPGGSSVTGMIKKKKKKERDATLKILSGSHRPHHSLGPNGHQCLRGLYVYGSREKKLLEKGQVHIFL